MFIEKEQEGAMRLIGTILFALSLGCAMTPERQETLDAKEARCHQLHNCFSRTRGLSGKIKRGLIKHCQDTNPLVSKRSCKKFQ